jgi:excisionase family DNA binding protein
MKPIQPRLISIKKAAEHTGIPYSSLRALAFKGRIEVVKIGAAWYFERADLDRLIESLKVRLD